MTAEFDAVVEIARQVGQDDVVTDAARVSERLAEGRFYVACLGRLKRGKSTLLNALVERQVLPTGLLPVTSVVTVLRHGTVLAARVRTGEPVQRQGRGRHRGLRSF